MTPPNEVMQRNLSLSQKKMQKQQAEINRLWRKVESLTADKAALLADVKILRTEKHADAEAIAAMRKDAAMDRLVAEGQRCDAMTPQEAAKDLIGIVEGINNLSHGTWRDEKGQRLKDTPEWVKFYNAISEDSHE